MDVGGKTTSAKQVLRTQKDSDQTHSDQEKRAGKCRQGLSFGHELVCILLIKLLGVPGKSWAVCFIIMCPWRCNCKPRGSNSYHQSLITCPHNHGKEKGHSSLPGIQITLQKCLSVTAAFVGSLGQSEQSKLNLPDPWGPQSRVMAKSKTLSHGRATGPWVLFL